jgi:branched-chain amino acid transport system ATP-binding protein
VSGSSATSSAVLELEDVSKRFGALAAVDGISLRVAAGERWALIGPNGAGKTTLFRLIAGEHSVSSGRVRLAGRDVTTMPENRRARLGVARTFQVTNLFADLTVEQNVVIAAQARLPRRYAFWRSGRLRGELADIVKEVLEQTGIADLRHRAVGELAHGEQRQLELAVALAQQPRLLLLDEPAAGLSAAERMLMHRLLSDLRPDLAVILVEHDMALAFDLAHIVLCMDNGVEVARGTPAEIQQDAFVTASYLKG